MPGVDLLPFFRGIFGGDPIGDQERFVCISFLRPGGKMVERFYRWPDKIGIALDLIDAQTRLSVESGRGADLYYGVSLTLTKRRTRDFIDYCHCIWADLDETPPTKLRLPPTFLVETSPGRYQAIWTLAEPIPAIDAEEYARRIYHAHHKDGADACWDSTRLLRIPGTPNLKYQVRGEGHPIVELISTNPVAYEIDEFDEAYPVSVSTGPGISQSLTLDYEQAKLVGSAEEILERYSRELTEETLRLFFDLTSPEHPSWSHRLWKLELDCFEAGMDIYEVFKVASESGCNKYARDGRPDADLWKEIVRARESHERQVGMVLTTTEIEEIDLLTPDEIALVQRQPSSFIDRYQRWASNRTDAPVAFHVGGALMALSSVLADKVQIATRFGNVKPNLWVMLLSDSTISRKTTSMNLSRSVVNALGVDALLATDGSIEGILTELEAREGQASVFVRDEFTSLVAGAKKKDYMAGFLADFCGLYDGTEVKRRLRKEMIRARHPVFLLFAGGVESKMLELLTYEDITSGFIPRFLPIFGQTSVDQLELIGGRRDDDTASKEAVVKELAEIMDRHTLPKPVMRVGGATIGSLSTPHLLEAIMEEPAWERLQQAQQYLLAVADSHQAKDLLLPCTERLIVNVLKVSTLIAASRLRGLDDEGHLRVTYDDLMISLYYARGWLDHLLRIVTRVGRDPFDSSLHKVLEMITAVGERGISRSEIMRNFRMSAREADEVFGTLLDREEIVSETTAKNGGNRGAVYRAGIHSRTAKQVRVTAPLKVRRVNPPPTTTS